MTYDIVLNLCGSGLFSCFTLRLLEIIKFFDKNAKLPTKIYANGFYSAYSQDDITNVFLEDHSLIELDIEYKKDFLQTFMKNEIFHTDSQFNNYRMINFDTFNPFIKKYFHPSIEILDIKNILKKKYNIEPVKTCGILYRGNDKIKETVQPSYSEFIEKAKYIQSIDPEIIFLIQTDEKEFLEHFKKEFKNSFDIEETLKINKNNSLAIQYCFKGEQLINLMKYYFASLLILSECKYLITTSGNGEFWLMLYRNKIQGVLQYLNSKTKKETNHWFENV
jgi:hypothetical protein